MVVLLLRLSAPEGGAGGLLLWQQLMPFGSARGSFIPGCAFPTIDGFLSLSLWCHKDIKITLFGLLKLVY